MSRRAPTKDMTTSGVDVDKGTAVGPRKGNSTDVDGTTDDGDTHVVGMAKEGTVRRTQP